ncbi:MAG: ABC transporter ATP-binding protein [Candidatus Atribacteria bacterium]|nr:ABC transporter ATP-binding protein [Candidatus Atribacteria bacterium]
MKEAYKIECINVSKSYNYGEKTEVKVLDKVNIKAKENEFVVVLGPGQSGKTTLFRLIAGFERPTAGEVYVNDKKVASPNPKIGFVFQKYMLFPWKTVIGNIEMGPKLMGISKKKRREIANYYIKLVGLEGFENYYPNQLSGGMKQRVGIARSYANNADILLLDEPFGQLDAQTRMFMEKEIMRMWNQEKKTVCFVTNNVDEAVFLADRIICLEGKLPGRVNKIYNVDIPRPREFTDIPFIKLREEIKNNMELIL